MAGLSVLIAADVKIGGPTIWLLAARDGPPRWWCDDCGATGRSAFEVKAHDLNALRNHAADHLRYTHPQPERTPL